MTREANSIHREILEHRTPIDTEVTEATSFLGRKITSNFEDDSKGIDEAVRTCAKAFQHLDSYSQATQEKLNALQVLVKSKEQSSRQLQDEQQQQYKMIASIFGLNIATKPYPVSQPIPIQGRRQSLSQVSGSLGSDWLVIKAETPTSSKGLASIPKIGCHQQNQTTRWGNLFNFVRW